MSPKHSSPVTEQLFQSCLSELTEGHLALDRLGAPREVQEGDVIRECLIAERISSVAQCAPGVVEISCEVDLLDDIEVDADGKCKWTDVANAQTHIRAVLHRFLPSTVTSTDGCSVLDPKLRKLIDAGADLYATFCNSGESKGQIEAIDDYAEASNAIDWSALTRPDGGGA